MINKVELGSVNSKNKSPNYVSIKSKNSAVHFDGLGDLALRGIQACEANPMVNVSVLDLSTAILPRTFFETFIGSKQKDENGEEHRKLNVFGGFEAFRRESSGLIINCLIPSFIVMGVAKLFNKPVMGDFAGSGLTKSWANGEAISNVQRFYTSAIGADSEERIYNTLKNMSGDIHGVDGAREKAFKDILANDEVYDELVRKTAKGIVSGEKELYVSNYKFIENLKKFFGIKTYKNYTDDLYQYVVNKTGISESIRFTGDKGYSTSSLKHLYDSTGDLLNGIVKTNIADNADKVGEFFKKANKLVNYKSAIGLGAFIIPLAISAQPINRWITHKLAGKKGAPIYNDDKERILTPEEKQKLNAQKCFAVPLMWGVAGLSMLMDRPSLKMFQFKNIFPTMDQARIISAATFSSRIAASEDSSELKENTIRDIATFSSFYFLGDYAAKGIATYLENHNKDGIKLINRLKESKDGANIFEKFWNWAKHTKMKSTDELSSIANEALRTKAKTMRAWCQVGNLVFSLLSLGIFIPLYTRTQTNKKKQLEAERTASAQTSSVAFTQNLLKDKSPAFKSFFN
ncbi:hypothetical protein IJ541_04675 [bacterium]|nr:hypothetical protein [bacterium]